MKIQQITNHLKNKLRNHFFRQTNLITYIEAIELIKQNSTAILIDVRSRQEYNEYHLEGAISIPTYELQKEIPRIITKKDQIMIVYCQTGARSHKAAISLRKMGYTQVYEIEGGIDSI